ncbi:YbaB/EbfC family nucleoid-associated protein [Sneathiella sp. HT1-7]|jgi:DNA-binding YbaB/EbfC family protein|uniref:YbaB/EbfC family nucleoid-associated protein n=1 Tax=Sneathiella sp. HT1-7 TaxID=2887192 RepID=UPI001D15BFB1|nr:YbaB/EbfC family nucleoid-associated protein [Sneathiella sp. HT1-7]MCC3303561.1 YbaB/EbfC family nucleoid-associated protein [Sneathiella sp. HT1-7]
MKNLGNLMKQAKEMQSKMAEMQAELEHHEVMGQSGAGMVKVTLNCKGEMRKLEVDSSLVDPEDKEVMEDLIIAAHADARGKVEAYSAEKMKEMTGGLELPPGMQMPF